jgi:hypothetical protein
MALEPVCFTHYDGSYLARFTYALKVKISMGLERLIGNILTAGRPFSERKRTNMVEYLEEHQRYGKF